MASTRECPSCALEFEDTGDIERCPYCDYEFPQRRSTITWVAWLLVLLLLIPAIKGLMVLFG